MHSRPPGPAFGSNLHSPGNNRTPWSSCRRRTRLQVGARKDIDKRRKRRPGTRGLRHRSQRRDARRKCWTGEGKGGGGGPPLGGRLGRPLGLGVLDISDIIASAAAAAAVAMTQGYAAASPSCRNLLPIDSRLNRINPSTNIVLPNPEWGYRTKFEILLEELFPNSIE